MERAFHAALKVNEVGLALVGQHHVAGLKVAVEEVVLFVGLAYQVGGQPLQVVLQPDFVEGQVGRFQKAVFEVVEVEHGRALVKADRFETLAEVQSLSPTHLNVGQQAYGACKQLNRCFVIGVVVAAGW